MRCNNKLGLLCTCGKCQEKRNKCGNSYLFHDNSFHVIRKAILQTES
jgi:hypothetical protein